jgi:hypothetical protein
VGERWAPDLGGGARANLGRRSQTTLIDSGAELFGFDNGGTALVERNRVGLEYDYRLAIIGTAGQVNLLH